jgi:hypothetical protein
MTTLLVHCFNTRDQSEGVLKGLPPESKCIVLLHDFGSPAAALRSNTRVVTVFDLLTEDEFIEVRDFSINMIKTWFKRDDQNISAWDGLSLGEALITSDTWGALFPAIRNHIVAHKTIQQTEAKEIYLGDSTSLDKTIWQSVADLYGARLHILTTPHDRSAIDVPTLQNNSPNTATVRKLWPFGKLNTIRQIVIDGTHILRGRLSRRSVLVEDRRPYWPNITREDLEKTGIPAAGLTGPLFSLLMRYYENRHGEDIRRHFKNCLEEFLPHINADPNFLFQGNSLSIALDKFFQNIFLNQFSGLAIEAMAIRRIVNWMRPDLLIATFRGDVTRRGRRWIIKQLHIPIYVIMTETTFHRPEAPLHPADFLAALGPSSCDWALQMGLPQDRYISLRRDVVEGYGYHIDDLRERMRAMTKTDVAKKYGVATDCSIVMYADQPFQLNDTGNTAYRRYKSFEILRDAIRAHSDTLFVIKFHPVHAWTLGEGNDANSRFEDFLMEGSPENVFFAPLEARFDEFLVLADIVVGQPESFSCCEAIMVNKPTVLLRPHNCQPFFKGFTPPDPASIAGCGAARYAGDAQELIEHLGTYLANDYTRTKGDQAASLALENYIYAEEEGIGRIESVFHCLKTLELEHQKQGHVAQPARNSDSSREV